MGHSVLQIYWLAILMKRQHLYFKWLLYNILPMLAGAFHVMFDRNEMLKGRVRRKKRSDSSAISERHKEYAEAQRGRAFAGNMMKGLLLSGPVNRHCWRILLFALSRGFFGKHMKLKESGDEAKVVSVFVHFNIKMQFICWCALSLQTAFQSQISEGLRTVQSARIKSVTFSYKQ